MGAESATYSLGMFFCFMTLPYRQLPQLTTIRACSRCSYNPFCKNKGECGMYEDLQIIALYIDIVLRIIQGLVLAIVWLIKRHGAQKSNN